MSKDPISILGQYWGFSSFKGSQKKIIDAILKQHDVLALLPTGGGKSVCFQVPALLLDGICIVVSPLIALIHDQVGNLKKKGIKAIALTGGIAFDELIDLLDNCLYGNYKFVYLSPERLQQEIVQEKIRQMNVNLIAIDEAHCISQWGHDFRPAYLQCALLRDLSPNTPIIALTATATGKVSEDIVTHLRLHDVLVVKDSFSRNNIAFKVLSEEDKRYRLKELCLDVDGSAIVYVRTRRMTEELARFLNTNGRTATYFHGGISKKEKQKKLNLWLENKVQVMVATNAFGMGVDKPDVQLVVHFQIPDSLENYFQEAGRAGRNGERAQAVILTNPSDAEQLKSQFLGSLPDVDFLKKVYHKINNYFQISYGEGTDQSFQFNFNDFVEVYGLNSFLTYNAFKVLDQYSVIALSESFSKKTTVRFLSSKEGIFEYLEKNQGSSVITQTILRTYGGIFDFETKINTSLIAKKASVSEELVLTVLQQLQKDGVIAYEAQDRDLEITFLVPREDDRTINVFAKKVKDQNETKAEKVRKMLNYINTTDTCRSKLILLYFGEKQVEDCGICDVCLKRYDQGKNDFEAISNEIAGILKDAPQTSRNLIKLLKMENHILLETIQRMLENNQIKVNTKNEYYLS